MANVPTVSWDETKPAGTRSIKLGDNDIKEMKTQIREIVDVDHKFDSSGQDADMGKHNKVSLLEAADIGTGEEGKPILGAQTVDGKAELVFTDEDDNDVQFTKAGEILPPASPTLANWAGVLELIYPIGSIYANASDDTNPGTLFGIGTWVAIEEEVIAGYKAGGTFGTLGSLESGAETVTLTAAQSGVPAHTHPIATLGGSEGSSGIAYIGQSGVNVATHNTNNNTAANASEAHNNIQPTYVAYLWRRTA